MRNKIPRRRIVFLFSVVLISLSFFSFAEEPSEIEPKQESLLHEKPSQVPIKIEIKPKAKDDAIKNRLESILIATNWFIDPQVEVENGVVFLTGQTKSHQFKDWAGDVANHTEDVAAVVNKMVVLEPSVWDVHMVLAELLSQVHKMIRALPGIIFGAIILFIAWILARLVYKLVPYLFRSKMHPTLLHEVIARGISAFVFLLGVYFIFEMTELTTMALTVISGTGLIGLILGIAFRDITENFLASILLSIQHPFHTGDLIDISGTGYLVTGYVDRLTLRVTILISLDGNHLQIPNATVYKSNICNYTTNPNRRESFQISIGTNCSISKAEETALKAVKSHEAILRDPEPLVLVDNLTNDIVNLRIYYWIDTRKHNWLKVKSTIIRLVKQAFQSENIEFPLLEASKKPSSNQEEKEPKQKEAKRTTSETESKHDSHKKKSKGLSSESQLPEQGENLLEDKDKPTKEKEQKP